MSNVSTCVEKLPHTCGSSDGLQVFESEDGTNSGYCFVCSTYVPNPYGSEAPSNPPRRQVKSDETRRGELQEVSSYGHPCGLVERKLPAKALSYFNCKVGVSMADGETPELLYTPYTFEGEVVRYKAKLLPVKKSWSVGMSGQVDFFGWDQAVKTGAKTLIITEGEADAIAGYTIFKIRNRGTQYETQNPAIVSLPNGAGNASNFIAKNLKKINRHFKEVVLAFDMDEPGREAAKAVSKVIPHAQAAELPAKDLNDCLLKGLVREAHASVQFQAKKLDNTRILTPDDLYEVAKKKPEIGLSWPWPSLTRATRGIRRGETIYFGAGVKLGKSELVNAVAGHLITQHDRPVYLVKPEESPAKTYKMLLGKVASTFFHDPNVEFDEAAFDLAHERVKDKLFVLDVYQFLDWDLLKQDIIHLVKSEDVKDVIIDPITAFTNQLSASETNEFLTGMAAEISAMTKDLDFTAYMFCHLKAPTTTKPHERGGAVWSSQFAGSRSMMRSANYMIGLEGNKDPDLPLEERHKRDLVILEDREFGQTDRIKLEWSPITSQFTERYD